LAASIRQVAGNVPRPELDHVSVRVGYVGCAAPTIAEVLQMNDVPRAVEPRDELVQVRVGEVKREVDVTPAALAGQGRHARQPEADPCPLSGHEPRCILPALHHGEPKRARVELLRAPKIPHSQCEFAYARARQHVLTAGVSHVRARDVASMSERNAWPEPQARRSNGSCGSPPSRPRAPLTPFPGGMPQ